MIDFQLAGLTALVAGFHFPKAQVPEVLPAALNLPYIPVGDCQQRGRRESSGDVRRQAPSATFPRACFTVKSLTESIFVSAVRLIMMSRLK